MEESSVIACLALGSNMGDSRVLLQQAVECIASHPKMRLLAESRAYRTAALLPDDAPPEWDRDFINMAVLVDTCLSARELLVFCKKTEAALGRQHRGIWGPREMDVDIITYGSMQMAEEDLTIPHREMHKRAFVLYPMADILDNAWKHPVLGVGIAPLIEQLDQPMPELVQ